ncbi:conserved protein of unknown function [Candidatus Nitrosocaldus cavascurensis]|uniref:Uncharacterized protein n=1 Tax=Candidatus Nitrosocaldus cavascurensis TaxID=2058097 RepID=A0A2K5ATG6_9ARCH|nr:conserved protein of unknown function [Candidatus Nitrosocaldus cavascurensis]
MVSIETTASLESFRRFLIVSTCKSFMPESYMRDPEVFPERENSPGTIYVEAADKVTLKKIGDITFVNAKDILGIIYSSKSGNTRLMWRQIRRRMGKVTGTASVNALVNLVESGVLTREWVEEYLSKSGITWEGEKGKGNVEDEGKDVGSSGSDSDSDDNVGVGSNSIGINTTSDVRQETRLSVDI